MLRALFRRIKRSCMLLLAAAPLLLGIVDPLVASPDVPNTEGIVRDVRQACLGTYIHGITEEIASREIGAAGVPALLELLLDPEFERPDNVVAFLSQLGDNGTVQPLLESWAIRSIPPRSPEEDRAILLVPFALGLLGQRGNDSATTALLDMAGPSRDDSPLGTLLARTPNPDAWSRVLLENTIHALSLTGDHRAQGRVQEIADSIFTDSLPVYASTVTVRVMAESAGLPSDLEPGFDSGVTFDPRSPEEPETASLLDSQSRVHATPLDYANHAELTAAESMSDDELDLIFERANLMLGRDAYDDPNSAIDDIACCASLRRDGPGRVFGVAGDGRAVINGSNDYEATVSDPVARVKVVRAIDWCGQPIPNILGCSRAGSGGYGMVLVRASSIPFEAVLWAHEYGHNVGNGHEPDPRLIMHQSIQGQNLGGFTQQECNTFHQPPVSANSTSVDVGPCGDRDGDDVHDLQDNCVEEENWEQDDSDLDGNGDACDICPEGDDNTDTDLDTVPDACDLCEGFDDSLDEDQDTIPDACDRCEGFDDTQDTDGDEVPDGCDICPEGDDSVDSDQDAVPDACDRCEGFDDSMDEDQDTVPDDCDLCEGFDDRLDADADAVPDGCDICPEGDDNADADQDSVPDACDLCEGFDDAADADLDTVPNGCDICEGFDDLADLDQDTVPDGCDVCPDGDDRLDNDEDGIPDDCDDCDWGDGPPTTGPGASLEFVDKDTLRWSLVAQAIEYPLYRGTIPATGGGMSSRQDAYDHECLQRVRASVVFDDPGLPSTQRIYYYLVGAGNPCGDAEGGLGTDTEQEPRPQPECL